MDQKRYAYLIGANGPPLQNQGSLKYAEQDTQRLATALKNQPCSFIKAECMLATDPRTTLFGLQQFSKECEPSDLLVVHFSGHAIYDEHLYLLCNETDPDFLIASAIDIALIKAILRQCRASHKLLILDCCHAGAAHSSALKSDPGIENVLDVLRETSQGSASVILSACSRREPTRELETLDGGAGFLSWALATACTTRFTEVSPDRKSLSLPDIWNWLPTVLAEVNSGLNKKHQIPKPRLLSEMEGGKDSEIWLTSQRRAAFIADGFNEQQQHEELDINRQETRRDFLQQYCPGARCEDFDVSKVIEYAEGQRDFNKLKKEDIEQLCRQLALASSQGSPRRAALLAFHPAPERYMHSALVRALAEISEEEGYFREIITGCLSEQVERTIQWIKSHLRTISENVGSGKRIDRYEIPEKAIRELVVNAILHREYRLNESVTVKITRSQITITESR